jgi:hypothetical protein
MPYNVKTLGQSATIKKRKKTRKLNTNSVDYCCGCASIDSIRAALQIVIIRYIHRQHLRVQVPKKVQLKNLDIAHPQSPIALEFS